MDKPAVNHPQEYAKMPAKDIELFQGLPISEQAWLLGRLEEIALSGGSVLFNAGDAGDHMYIVLDGHIELLSVAGDGSRYSLAVLGSGETFGEMSLLTGEPRSAVALALDDVNLYQIDYYTFKRMADTYPSIAQYLLRLISRRLVQTNENLHQSRSISQHLVAEDLGKLPTIVRNIVLAQSVVPTESWDFIAEYCDSHKPIDELSKYADDYPHIIHLNKAGLPLVNPAYRGILAEIYSREYPMEKEALISSAVAFFKSHDLLLKILQLYSMNSRWTEVLELITQNIDEITRDDAIMGSLPELLEACPNELLYNYYETFILFLDSCLDLCPYLAWAKLEAALSSGDNRFSNEQMIALYERAAALCKQLGDWQNALDYLHTALAISSTTDNSELFSKPADSSVSDRQYQLAQQQLFTARSAAWAQNARLMLTGKGLPRSILMILLVIGSLAYFSESTPLAGLSRPGMLFTGITVAAIILWIFNRVPGYLVALLMAMAWVVLGLATPREAFAGFSNPYWLGFLFILTLGLAVSNSGLAYRLSLFIVKLFPRSYIGQLMGLAAGGLLVNCLLPSRQAKVSISSPLAHSLAKAMHLPDRSHGTAAMVLLATMFFGFTAPFVLTGSYTNIVALGLFPPGVKVDWSAWFIYALPALLVFTLGIFIWASIFCRKEATTGSLPKRFLNDQLDILGKMTRNEKIVLVVILSVICLMALQGLHHIDDIWIMLSGFAVLALTGVLDFDSMKSLDWPFFIFIGVIFSFSSLSYKIGLSPAIAMALLHYCHPLISSPYLLIVFLAIISLLFSFLIRDDLAFPLIMIFLLPLVQKSGVHPWILLLTVMLSCDPFFFRNQSPTYLTAFFSTEGRAFGHRQGRNLAFFYALLVIISLLLSIPYWQYLGLIS
ncbi:MAG: SLC13 family permease [Deltaproteobacteria bacterium]